MTGRRQQARQLHGKGGGLELAWKLQANRIYGVLTSKNQVTSNVVAGNVVTATGRAGAFALINALNAIQVITDGCTYRRDQIPACTFAECLELQPGYSLRRAEDGGRIPFLDPAAIPVGDREFTAWYRSHVRRFFGLDAEAEDTPFDLHDLEHKATLGGASFDALACDGGSCDIKCSRAEDGSWEALDASMRGHGRESKEILQPSILETYPHDRMETLPPISKNRDLLKTEEAKARARRYLNPGWPSFTRQE